MNLVDMALPDDDQVKEMGAMASDCPQSKYGYGLSIRLDDDQCKALGLDRALPSGTLVNIQAKGVVESSNERVDPDKDENGPEVGMSIQITNLGVEATGSATNAADMLYTNPTSKGSYTS